MKSDETVVFLTGASSGIGNAIAAFLAKRGYRVYGTSRDPGAYAKKADEFFELIAMDVTKEESIHRAVGAVMEREGKIDVLICNAGMGIAGSIEESSLEEARLQLETNFFGALRTIRSVLPCMRASRHGKILVLSSIAGLIGLPFQGLYSASKFALEGLIEALRYEIAPFGVQACLIEPGDFRTGFTSARRIVRAYSDNPENSPYHRNHETVIAIQIRDESAGQPPLKIAKRVLRLLEAKRLKPRYTIGPFVQRAAVMIKRIIPGAWFEKLFASFYKLG